MSFKIEKFLNLRFATLTLTVIPVLGSANIKQCFIDATLIPIILKNNYIILKNLSWLFIDRDRATWLTIHDTGRMRQ